MTLVLAWVVTDLLESTAWLHTLAACILALTRAMAGFTTSVYATLQLSAAHLAASDISKPALLIFQLGLAADAVFLDKEWTAWTWLFIDMAVVLHLRMAAGLGSLALVSARRRLSAAWQWRLKYSPAAIADDLVEYGFSTTSARPLVAELLTHVLTAFE